MFWRVAAALMKNAGMIFDSAFRAGARRLPLALSVVLLAGCAGAPPQTFDLAAPAGGYRARVLPASLSVDEPAAMEPLDSDRLVVRVGSGQVAYLSGVQWSGQLTRLVQDRLIGSFENAHMLAKLRRPGEVADYRLALEIRRFDLDVETKSVRVEIAARLFNERNARVVAAQVFTAEAPSTETVGAAPPAALDVAFGDVARQIVDWSAKKI